MTGKRIAVQTAALLGAIYLWTGIAAGTSTGARDEAECAEVKARIREIQDRMRAGYTNEQGERYKARLRRLNEKRRRVCR